MKLMTKLLEKRFAQVGSQAEEKDPLIVAKLFNPCGTGTLATIRDGFNSI